MGESTWFGRFLDAMGVILMMIASLIMSAVGIVMMIVLMAAPFFAIGVGVGLAVRAFYWLVGL